MKRIDDQEEDLGPLEDVIRIVRSALKPGGPEVDFGAILGFIDQTLSAEETERVDKLIHTWRDWYCGYLKLYGWSLEDEEDSLKQHDVPGVAVTSVENTGNLTQVANNILPDPSDSASSLPELVARRDELSRSGRLEEATAVGLQLCRLSEAVFGDINAEVAEQYHETGKLFIRAKRWSEAQKHFERAVDLRFQIFGQDDPLTVSSRILLEEALKKVFSSGSLPERFAGAASIGKIGASAIAFFDKFVRNDECQLVRYRGWGSLQVNTVGTSHDFPTPLSDWDHQLRLEAAMMFDDLGSRSIAAMEQMISDSSPKHRQMAAWCLGEIGRVDEMIIQSSIPLLISHAQTNSYCANALSGLRSVAIGLCNELIGSADIREFRMGAYGHYNLLTESPFESVIRQESEIFARLCIDSLIGKNEERQNCIRELLARTFIRRTGKGTDFLDGCRLLFDQFKLFLRDNNARIRQAACEAFSQNFTPLDSDVLALKELLIDPEDEVVLSALRGLKRWSKHVELGDVINLVVSSQSDSLESQTIKRRLFGLFRTHKKQVRTDVRIAALDLAMEVAESDDYFRLALRCALDDDPLIARKGIEYLGRAPQRSATRALKQWFATEGPIELRVAALRSLGKRGQEAPNFSLEEYIVLLRRAVDPHLEVAAAALDVIASYKMPIPVILASRLLDSGKLNSMQAISAVQQIQKVLDWTFEATYLCLLSVKQNNPAYSAAQEVLQEMFPRLLAESRKQSSLTATLLSSASETQGGDSSQDYHKKMLHENIANYRPKEFKVKDPRTQLVDFSNFDEVDTTDTEQTVLMQSDKSPATAEEEAIKSRRGRVMRINTTSGFGFIASNEMQIFFDAAAVVDDRFKELYEGQEIEYDTDPELPFRAINIRAIPDESLSDKTELG